MWPHTKLNENPSCCIWDGYQRVWEQVWTYPKTGHRTRTQWVTILLRGGGSWRASLLRALQVWRGPWGSDPLSPEGCTFQVRNNSLLPVSLLGRPWNQDVPIIPESPCGLSHSHDILFIPLVDCSVRMTLDQTAVLVDGTLSRFSLRGDSSFFLTSQMSPLIFYHPSISMASKKNRTLTNKCVLSPFLFLNTNSGQVTEEVLS